MHHTISIFWDDEASTWVALCDTIPLALEDDSFDALIRKVEVAAAETLEENFGIIGNYCLHLKAERLMDIASGQL